MAGKQKKVKKITKINPVKPQVMMQLQPTKRVCAYCRVSTDSREQQNSFIAQTAYYEELISKRSDWQIKQLSHLMWLNEEQNVILLGKCGTGKTSLAVHLGETVIDNGHKTYCASIDTFVSIVENKDINPKAGAAFSYMRECNLIIIDDAFLNETRSIIFITNREISAWLDAVEDKHLCQTLLDRITANCQIIRLTDR